MIPKETLYFLNPPFWGFVGLKIQSTMKNNWSISSGYKLKWMIKKKSCFERIYLHDCFFLSFTIAPVQKRTLFQVWTSKFGECSDWRWVEKAEPLSMWAESSDRWFKLARTFLFSSSEPEVAPVRSLPFLPGPSTSLTGPLTTTSSSSSVGGQSAVSDSMEMMLWGRAGSDSRSISPSDSTEMND